MHELPPLNVLKVRNKQRPGIDIINYHTWPQYTTWESDKNTRKHHIQESQEVSHFPAGDHKAAMNRQGSMTDTKHK